MRARLQAYGLAAHQTDREAGVVHLPQQRPPGGLQRCRAALRFKALNKARRNARATAPRGTTVHSA